MNSGLSAVKLINESVYFEGCRNCKCSGSFISSVPLLLEWHFYLNLCDTVISWNAFYFIWTFIRFTKTALSKLFSCTLSTKNADFLQPKTNVFNMNNHTHSTKMPNNLSVSHLKSSYSVSRSSESNLSRGQEVTCWKILRTANEWEVHYSLTRVPFFPCWTPLCAAIWAVPRRCCNIDENRNWSGSGDRFYACPLHFSAETSHLVGWELGNRLGLVQIGMIHPWCVLNL